MGGCPPTIRQQIEYRRIRDPILGLCPVVVILTVGTEEEMAVVEG